MAPRIALLMLLTGACSPQYVDVASGKARFPDYPVALFSAFESACAGPAQTFSRPEPGLVECREFLPPEPTAAIILGFDGTPEQLPQMVIRFRTQEDATGYLVENDVFLHVPRKTGQPLKVRQRDARLARMLQALYRRAGGVPEA